MRRRREAILALGAATAVILALLAVFAIELANTQAKSKRDVTARVHERAVLAAALIDSLFQSVQQQIPQDARIYGARTVSARTMNRNQAGSAYIALLDAQGNVIAASAGFTAQARVALTHSSALALIRSGHPYGLGNLIPYGKAGAIDFAVAFPTRYGNRTLLTGFTPLALSTFITADLRKIPGVKGAHNYLIDGNLTVLATTNPARPVGYVFRQPAQVKALGQASGDRLGSYFDQVQLSNSTWRIVLAAPNGPLFASVPGCANGCRGRSSPRSRCSRWPRSCSAGARCGPLSRCGWPTTSSRSPTATWRRATTRSSGVRRSSRDRMPSSSSSPRSPPTISRSRCGRSARSPSS